MKPGDQIEFPVQFDDRPRRVLAVFTLGDVEWFTYSKGSGKTPHLRRTGEATVVAPRFEVGKFYRRTEGASYPKWKCVAIEGAGVAILVTTAGGDVSAVTRDASYRSRFEEVTP